MLKLVPIFNHLRVLLSRLTLIEPLLKPDPATTPFWLKYSPEREKVLSPSGKCRQ